MEGNYYSRNEPAIPRVSEKQPEQCRGCGWGTWTGVNQLCMLPSPKKSKLKGVKCNEIRTTHP